MAATAPSSLRVQTEELGELAGFSLGSLRQLPGAIKYLSEVLRQLAILVRGSTLFIAVVTLFIGFSATSYGYYFLKAAGAADYIGLVPGVSTPRVTAALLFGYGFAAKVACGFTAEIGAMKISEELDAYEVEGTSVMRYVVGTRLAAALLYVPIITPIALVAATLGSLINSVFVLNAVPQVTFFQYNWANQSLGDQFFALATILILALVMTLVACFYGLRARGGPADVGRVVSRSLVVNLVAIHVILGLADFAIYGTNLKLPIGG
jgi:phospholipid/cholesterol/gamma-HCH transport system permease protein